MDKGFPKIGSTSKINYQRFTALAGKGGGIRKVPGDDICLPRWCSTTAVCWKHEMIGSHQLLWPLAHRYPHICVTFIPTSPKRNLIPFWVSHEDLLNVNHHQKKTDVPSLPFTKKTFGTLRTAPPCRFNATCGNLPELSNKTDIRFYFCSITVISALEHCIYIYKQIPQHGARFSSFHPHPFSRFHLHHVFCFDTKNKSGRVDSDLFFPPKTLCIALFKVFVSFKHGIHHHKKPPFGKKSLELFPTTLSKSK